MSCACLWPCAAFGGSAGPQLTIKGRQRTSADFIHDIFQKCWAREGADGADEPHLHLVEQCILNYRIFSEVKLERQGEEVTLTIHERWTLIPVPLIRVDSSGRQIGFYLIDTNVWGRGKTVVMGGLSSTDSTAWQMIYVDPAIDMTPWRGTLVLSNARNNRRLHIGDREITGLGEGKQGLNLGIGYTLDAIILSAIASYNKEVLSPLAPYNIAVSTEEKHMLGVRLDYIRQNYKFYFNEGHRLSLQLLSTPPGGRHSWVDVTVQNGLSLSGRQVLQTTLTMAATSGSDLADEFWLGGQRGFRGTPIGTIWAHQYGSISVDYQNPISDLDFGTLTWGTFVDMGEVLNRGLFAYRAGYRAVGVGSYIYLKAIAVPGMGMELVFNNRDVGGQLSFSMGMQI